MLRPTADSNNFSIYSIFFEIWFSGYYYCWKSGFYIVFHGTMMIVAGFSTNFYFSVASNWISWLTLWLFLRVLTLRFIEGSVKSAG